MAELTVNGTASNGPVAVGESAFSDPGETLALKALTREIDFAKQGFKKSLNYVFMPVPKGFLATYVAVEQTGALDADVTLTFARKSDSAAVGGSFACTDDGAALLRSVQPAASVAAKDSAGTGTVSVPGALLFDADDTLCVKVPATSDLTVGGLRVSLLGYMPFGDSAEFGNGSEPMRKGRDSGLDNTASPDYND